MAVCLWIACVAAALLLVRFDVELLRVVRRLGDFRESQTCALLRRLAEPLSLTIAVVLVALFDRRRRIVICHVLFAVYIAANAMLLCKLLVSRERPLRFASLDAATWTSSWHGVAVDFLRRSSFASFPSGHSTAVFAAAAALAWFYPRLAVPILSLAAGCAASRALQNWHWPSDCFVGALIGCLAAWLSLHTRALSTPRHWFHQNGPKAAESR